LTDVDQSFNMKLPGLTELDKLSTSDRNSQFPSQESAFSLDGTLIEAWASHKSFKPKDDQDSDGEDFHGTKRKNDTHASTTDPDSRGADVAYAAARFVGIVHATMPGQNLSLGMWNAEPNTLTAVLSTDADELQQISHGDAGFVVVDVQDYSWQAYGGYLSAEARGAA